MTDVRLTALNPEDSSVVPVACNAQGELLVEGSSGDYLPTSGGNLTGDLTLGTDKITLDATSGAATFAGDNLEIRSTGQTRSKNGFLAFGTNLNSTPFRVSTDDTGSPSSNVAVIYNDGSAIFAGDVVIGSRSKQWMIVESNGLAHLVEQTAFGAEQTAFGAEQTAFGAEQLKKSYPPLRDIPSELTMVEQQLQKVMERLKMAPEAGWEVWDGSD